MFAWGRCSTFSRSAGTVTPTNTRRLAALSRSMSPRESPISATRSAGTFSAVARPRSQGPLSAGQTCATSPLSIRSVPRCHRTPSLSANQPTAKRQVIDAIATSMRWRRRVAIPSAAPGAHSADSRDDNNVGIGTPRYQPAMAARPIAMSSWVEARSNCRASSSRRSGFARTSQTVGPRSSVPSRSKTTSPIGRVLTLSKSAPRRNTRAVPGCLGNARPKILDDPAAMAAAIEPRVGGPFDFDLVPPVEDGRGARPHELLEVDGFVDPLEEIDLGLGQRDSHMFETRAAAQASFHGREPSVIHTAVDERKSRSGHQASRLDELDDRVRIHVAHKDGGAGHAAGRLEDRQGAWVAEIPSRNDGEAPKEALGIPLMDPVALGRYEEQRWGPREEEIERVRVPRARPELLAVVSQPGSGGRAEGGQDAIPTGRRSRDRARLRLHRAERLRLPVACRRRHAVEEVDDPRLQRVLGSDDEEPVRHDQLL